MINFIKKEVRENKSIYIVAFFSFLILAYTHFNTFVANDDLPYSFLYRGSDRITSLGQVLANQLADYKNLNARFFVHCILQSVLIFGKSLWSILNPLMIVISMVMLLKIIKLKTKNFNNFLSVIIFISCFLLMINYKWVIYWVAGSINYVWVFTFLSIILYLFYKYGFCKYKVVNTIIIAILCAICECTMVFTICFVICNFVLSIIKNKKIDYSYFIYFLGFLGSLVLLLSPSTALRMGSDEVWSSLSLIQKLLTSIPVVSKNLFNLTNIYNVLPYIFIFSVIASLRKLNTKYSNISILIIIINIVLIYFVNNNWLYFTLTLLLVNGEFYCHIKNNKTEFLNLSLAMYAVIFFNILIPLYYAARPNYYFYLYMIFYFVYTLNYLDILNEFKENRIFIIIVLLPFLTLFGNEIYVYTKIGNYYSERLKEIEEYKNTRNGDLILTKIPEKYCNYHIDINEPTKDWFTYKYFLDYYDLDENTNIIFK